MIAPEETVAVLLCAGLSRRFGPEDKLPHPFRGRPLVAHAARMLATLPHLGRVAVVAAGAVEPEDLLAELGFAIARNEAPEAGQQRSLRLGAAAALALDPAAMLLCLGDMPFVPADHLAALAGAAAADRPAASVGDDGALTPPCLFPRALLDRIVGQERSASARTLLEQVPGLTLVPAPPGASRDLDTPADFAEAA